MPDILRELCERWARAQTPDVRGVELRFGNALLGCYDIDGGKVEVILQEGLDSDDDIPVRYQYFILQPDGSITERFKSKLVRDPTEDEYSTMAIKVLAATRGEQA